MRIEPERGRRDGEPFLLSIETAIAEIFPPEKAPKLRTVRERMELSRAMENCPLGVTRNCPLLGITEERANERGPNHGKPVVE